MSPPMPLDPSKLESLRPFVRGLCYRMTGSLSDAEDLVQETFLRLMEKPPPEEGDLKPWVARVSVNLARDAYRRRRRMRYIGPWLPSPTEDDEVIAYEPAETQARYDLVESASMAFLVALEALSARQRSVLLLRDVLDYSVEETATALGMTEGAVKVTHHRARKRMEGYDASHAAFSLATATERTQETIARFAAALGAGDAAALEALFSEDAVALSDGGGEFVAALLPIRGPARIARFFLSLMRFHEDMRASLAVVNGLPAVVAAGAAVKKKRLAPRHVTTFDVDERGIIRSVSIIVATAKLTGISFPV
jgi:RNA polymerase sigma-70 factor (ECF subfamily)